jgi:hypothetical protein
VFPVRYGLNLYIRVRTYYVNEIRVHYSHVMTGKTPGKLFILDRVLMPRGSCTDNCS